MIYYFLSWFLGFCIGIASTILVLRWSLANGIPNDEDNTYDDTDFN